ncbi:MAG: sugar phosphate isomerase/epimerase family protein [Caldicoprobacterales bacterium]|jgi:sugar phosphate isomerase/epimerase
MAKPITLASGQFADMPLEELCKIVSDIGYDGLELASWGHVDVSRAATDLAYCKEIKDTLAKYDLSAWAIEGHLAGQCVGDVWDSRLDGFAPSEFAGDPAAIRQWGIDEMKRMAHAAKNLDIKIITCFMGSPIWKYWYSFPQTTEEMVEAGFKEIYDLWTPIFDVFDECGVKLALEVHPAEIAFDYWTTKKLFEVFENRPTLGLNFDPSHLIWQGVDPVIFLQDFIDKVYHVHAKDAVVNLDGRNGILGSHLNFGDPKRGWNFVSLGHGDVDFDRINRVLNWSGYDGPVSVEWEDSGMERIYGITEAFEYIKSMNFEPSDMAFDEAMKTD